MAELHTAAEAAIHAPAETVISILRDVGGHHRAILPPAFNNLIVEEGGVGAGTVSRFDFTLGGRTRPVRTRIEEPAHGIIEEHVIGRDMVTTFTVTPDGEGSVARIETDWQPVDGIAGILERLFAPRMLRSIYREELARLDAHATAIGSSRTAGPEG